MTKDEKNKVEVFGEIFQAKAITSLYKELPIENLYTDYYGEIDGSLSDCIVSIPGFVNIKIDRCIELETVIAIDECAQNISSMEAYVTNSTLEAARKIRSEIEKESPTRFAAQVVLGYIEDKKISFCVCYGFAWEPKSFKEKLAEKVVEDAHTNLSELLKGAKVIKQTATELAGGAMAGLGEDKEFEDKDSFQLTRDIKRYQHQRLIKKLEGWIKQCEGTLEVYRKSKNIPTAAIFNCMRDLEETRESLAYVKSYNLSFNLYD